MKYIILGAGQAGCTAAKTIRENSPDAEILIFDRDRTGLYAKMRLPEFVAGTLPESKLILSDEKAFREKNIEPYFGVNVTAVRPDRRRIETEDGRHFSYDKLIFATGADAFVPPVEGLDKVESFTLRTLADARKIAAKAESENASALVIGGGLLGLETAWALRQRGFAVTVSEYMDRLLPRQLNEAESGVLLEKLGSLDLQIKLGVSLKSVEPGGKGLVSAHFSDGSSCQCSLLLFSAGIRPQVSLAAAAGLDIGRAIKVDHRLQTSAPDIYAAGDCAELDGVTPGLWRAAQDQGTALGKLLTGKQERFDLPVYTPVLKIGGIQLKEIREIARRQYDVFISYRREGGFETAKLVNLSLREHGYRVFFDLEKMRSGNFNEQLYDVIDSASDFVLVLSKNALERCNNEGDWLRREVEQAMQSRKNIIPYMQNDFEWPVPMPAALEGLQYKNGVTASQDYFDASIDKLEKLLTARPVPKPAPPTAPTSQTAPPQPAPRPAINFKRIFWFIVVLILLLIAGSAGLWYFLRVTEQKVEEARKAAEIEQEKRDAERRARVEAERKAEQERQRHEAERRAEEQRRQEAERKLAEARIAEAQAKLEAERKLAEARAAAAQAKLEAEKAERARAEALLRAEKEAAERRAKAEAEAREARLAAERKARIAAEAQAKLEAEKAERTRAEALLRAEKEAAERKAKADADAREQAGIAAERKAKADADAREQAGSARPPKPRAGALRKRVRTAPKYKSKREEWIAKGDHEVKTAAAYIKCANLNSPTLNDAVMAARCADLKALATIRENGFSDWKTPEIILAASKTPFLDTVKTVHKLGGNINAKNKHGKTVLMFASEQAGNTETVKYLIASGAKIDAKEKHDWTALLFASKTPGNVETVKHLISSGAEVNAKDEDGWSILMHAASVPRNAETVRYLAGRGADVNAKARNGRTALMVASSVFRNVEMVKVLVRSGADVNAKRNDGRTALMFASGIFGNLETVKYLIASGADVFAKDEDDRTALMYALRHSNDAKTVQYLAGFRSGK